MHPSAQSVDQQVFYADHDDPQAVDIRFRSRGIFTGQAGWRRRLEQQIEFNVVPVAALALETQAGKRRVYILRDPHGEIHIRGCVTARGVELEGSPADEDRLDAHLR